MAQYDIATLYRRHAERLTRYVRQRVGSAEEAEDIVQNVFLELCKPGVLNRADKDIDAYVFGARHLTSQHLKKVRAQETALTKFLSASEPLSPCTESDRGESEVGRIQTLLMQLPPKAQRTAIQGPRRVVLAKRRKEGGMLRTCPSDAPLSRDPRFAGPGSPRPQPEATSGAHPRGF